MDKELNIPENYQAVMPYLILKDAAAFIAFAIQVLGAKEQLKEMRDENIVRHAEIKIADSTIMVAEATSDFSPQNAGLFIYVADADESCKEALAAGAELIMEVEDKPYGRSGGIKDPFGNTWWITSAD